MNPDRCTRLADAIANLLANGLPLDGDTLQFITSTVGDLSPGELASILADERHPEAPTLLELVFFPTEDEQMQLEDVLESAAFDADDESAVLAALMAAAPRVTIRLGPQGASLHLALPEAAATAWIARLNIARRLDPQLRIALEASLAPDDTRRAKVQLRNAPRVLSAPAAAFLTRSVPLLAGGEGFFECLAFLLAFFDETPRPDDVFEALRIKKRFLFRGLQIAQHQADLLRAHALETLMAQGSRLPCVPADTFRRHMQLIDHICRAVFGRVAWIEAAVAPCTVLTIPNQLFTTET